MVKEHENIISVDGYKAFRGVMGVYRKDLGLFDQIEGDWLYKPDTDCWYCDGCSYPAGICEINEVY